MTIAPTLQNTYATSLDGAYVFWRATASPDPKLLALNESLAVELGIDLTWLGSDDALAIFAGRSAPEGATPLAQAYAGHQFGSYSPLLGDGRALLLGELLDTHGQRRDIALKGSGATPFSRGGDGRAAVGPVLREYVMGEAMHQLGIPTTRALAAVSTGEEVRRETTLPGAVLTRVAASHLRVGTFEFAARRSVDLLRALADYAIDRHYPSVAQTPAPQRYLDFFASVCQRQAELIAGWMGIGFIHGVMNTDNMTISGETIDYGPCAFMEAYDPRAAFSSIDHGRRYAYSNQPTIAQWNLARLAETLIPLVVDGSEKNGATQSGTTQDAQNGAAQHAIDQFTSLLDDFEVQYRSAWIAVMRAKLGLAASARTSTDDEVAALAEDYLDLLHVHHVDFTLGFRHLTDAVADGEPTALRELFTRSSTHPDGPHDALAGWLQRWHQASLPPVDVTHTAAGTETGPEASPEVGLEGSSDARRAETMRRANPIYIPRNHLVENALEGAVTRGDLEPFHALLEVVKDPFTERDGLTEYATPAPADVTAYYRTFCGT